MEGGVILGLSEGLRVVQSKERVQRGLELAPLGRAYVCDLVFVRIITADLLGLPDTLLGPWRVPPNAIFGDSWFGRTIRIPNSIRRRLS